MPYNDFFEPEVSESVLPGDDTPSLGSNYGMDGFQFDSDYGEGVLDGARLPEVAGLSALPDGVMRTASPYDFATGVMLGEPEGSDYGTNLSEMLEENSLAGLGWLHGEQDPDRLPKNPVDRGIMELEKAWGVHDRTTGLLIPNKVYRAPDNDPHHEGFDRVEAGDLIKLVKQAARRSAYGHPLKAILRDAVISLQPSAREQVEPDLRRIAADHGLRGKVFIEASAFPGLKNGKYASEIHRYCGSARYVVVPKSMDQNTRDRIASVTGKTPVTEVPWKEAFDHYAPRLKATGHRVATSGDYRERLKLTLASKERVQHESTAPVQKFAVDQISAEDAKRKFAQMPAERLLAPDAAKMRAAKEMQQAKQQVRRWVKAGLLDKEQAQRILRASFSPHDMVLKAAATIAEARKRALYGGEGLGKNHVLATASEKQLAPLVDTETLRAAKAKQAAEQQVRRWVKAGLLDKEQAQRILRASLAPAEMLRLGSEAIAAAKQQAQYEGQGEGKNSVREQFHRPVASPVSASVLRKAKWVMERMNEGWAGQRLSELIRKRFAGKTASDQIAQLRKAHEGLAGFVYVDASVYASDKGSKGCDDGALVHRANSLKYVLAMDRCGTCVHATEGKCQKYAKKLLESNDGLTSIQRKNIKAADASDAEDTRSMFAPTYQNDYSLQYDDEVDVEDEMPSEVLDGLLMDGVATMDNGGDLYEGLDLDEVMR